MINQKQNCNKFASNSDNKLINSVLLQQKQIKSINQKQGNKHRTDKLLQILVRLQDKDELESTFIQYFSTYIISNPDSYLIDYFSENTEVNYEQFHNLLKILHEKNHQSSYMIQARNKNVKLGQNSIKRIKSSDNIHKSSYDKLSVIQKIKCIFNFESFRNQIIFLLDLSPYMLIYDSSTKSFPLKNMEEIISNLMDSLQWHYQSRKNKDVQYNYYVSVYGFSTNHKQILEFLKNQKIFFKDKQSINNKQKIKDFINICVSESSYPYQNNQSIYKISQFIQKVVNYQQGKTGVQTIITISTFQDFDNDARIFFSSSWFTFAFICTGFLNFATYTIQDKQIIGRFPINPYFKTKYVYKCQFYQNWEKIQLIQKNSKSQFKHLTTATQKNRCILYDSGQQIKQTIFEDILKFKIEVQPNKRRKIDFFKSNQNYSTTIFANSQFNIERFQVQEQNITEIMKTKYLQGWENSTPQGYYQNTKFDFKLHLGNGRILYYQAKKNGTIFNIKIYQESLNQGNISDQIIKEKSQLIDSIKKIDLINTSGFDIIKKKDTKGYYNFDSRGYQGKNLIQFIFYDHPEQWNRYFKVKKICLRFRPSLNMTIFNEFIAQTGLLFGDRISNLCFLNRKEEKALFHDGIQSKHTNICKIIFTKMLCQENIIQIKLGFLKFKQPQINDVVQNIISKIKSCHLNQVQFDIVPQELFKFCHRKFSIQTPSIFKKQWVIGFPDRKILYDLFKAYNAAIIKRLGYLLIKSRTPQFIYYKLINFVDSENIKHKKVVFLKVKITDKAYRIDFTLETFPSFHPIKQFSNYILQQRNQQSNTSIPNCFQTIIGQLKDAQKKITNVLKNYGGLYDKLFNNHESKIKNPKTRLSFRKGRSSGGTQSINIDEIPEPNQYLMQSEIINIKGDLTLSSTKDLQKSFTFYSVRNNMVIYLRKKQKQIFYRCMSIYFMTPQFLEEYQNQNFKQYYNNFYDSELQKCEVKKIIENIKVQQRQEKYQLFYQAVRLGENTQIMASYEQNLKDFYQPYIDFTDIAEIVRTKKYSHVVSRFDAVLSQFYKQFLKFIQIFFQRGKNEAYFFQKEITEISNEYFISDKSLGTFNNLILKLQYGQNTVSFQQCFSQANFIKLFLDNEQPGYITLKFYGFTLSYEKIEELISKLRQLIKQTVILLNIVIVSQQSGFSALQKYLRQQAKFILSSFEIKIPEQLINSHYDICRYIQQLSLDSFLKFHPINQIEDLNKSRVDFVQNKKYEYCQSFVAIQDQISKEQKINTSFKICLRYWLNITLFTQQNLMKIQYAKFGLISLTQNIKTGNFQKSIIQQVHKYVFDVLKQVKVHNTFKSIERNLRFPTDTFVSIYINEANFLKLKQKQEQKKKNAVGLGHRHPIRAQKFKINKPQKQMNTKIFIPDPDTFYLKLIHVEYIQFYAKLTVSQIVRRLAHSQKLNACYIRNLVNTFIFFNQILKQYFFFYFEEVVRQPISPQKGQKKEENQSTKKNLKLQVYCINQCFKIYHEEYINHLKLIKMAMQQVTLDRIAEDINKSLSHYVLDNQEQEWFKGGQKWSFQMKLPKITEKYNFRQYLKQHLEKEFFHIRADFRSQLKNKQVIKQDRFDQSYQLNQQRKSFMDRYSETQGDALQQNYTQIEGKINIQNKSNCKQCVPSMWIFSTLMVPEMHMKYGRCIYLLKIQNIYSYSSVENADLWKRSSKNTNKTYVYPNHFERCQQMRQDTQFEKISQKLNLWDENKDQGLNSNNGQIGFIDQEQNQMILKFQVISYFQSPKFTKLENAYRSFVYCSLYDYWFENYAFNVLCQIPLRTTTTLNNCPKIKRIMSSPMKGTYFQPINNQNIKKVYKSLIIKNQQESCQDFSSNHQFQQQSIVGIPNIFSQKYSKISKCHYLHRPISANKLLIQDKFIFVEKIITQFSKLFIKEKNQLIIPLIIYIKTHNQQYLMWELFLKNKKKTHSGQTSRSVSFSQYSEVSVTSDQSTVSMIEPNEGIMSNQLNALMYLRRIKNYLNQNKIQTQKIGVLFLDSLKDLLDLSLEKSESSKSIFCSSFDEDEEIVYKSLKYFHEGQSFCMNEFLFKRSLFMNFQCSKNNFMFFSYNFVREQQQFINMKSMLHNLERWYFEKNRLLEFIKSAKMNEKLSNGKYHYPPKFVQNLENQIPSSIKEQIYRKQEFLKNRINSHNLTKLIKQLILNKQPNDQNFIQKESMIENMYQILSKKTINYKKYPQYKQRQKNQEKSLLQIYGWEYLSLLRAQYGVQYTFDSSQKQQNENKNPIMQV